MAQYDLDLSSDQGLFSLGAPITDDLERMRNRFRVQLLSCRQTDGRGCTLYTELTQSRVKTNSDVISLFALSAAEIILNMRLYQEDIYPNRATLTDFQFVDGDTLQLTFTLYTTEGSLTDNVEVTT